MKTAARLICLSLLSLGLLVLPAFAQSPGDLANLERELDRTEELISRASELAALAGNAQALELLKNAIELQREAREAFRVGRFEMARIRTTAARTIAARVMALLLDPEERADRVEHELGRTDELLAKAREAVGPAGSDVARSMLEAAYKQQAQAWELFRAGSHRPALRMTLQVREMLNRIRLQMEQFEPARMEEAFRRTEELVKRATEAALAGSARVVEMAERAAQFLRRAHEFVSNGRYLAARHHLTQAQRFAFRALRLAGGQPNDEAYERLAEEYQADLTRLVDRLSRTHNEAASRLVGESQEHFQLSQELFEAGPESQERSFTELNLALRLLNKAGELLE